ncbi:MAG: Ig-like domain-containing protein [Gemmatimonadaceae bacterium]|nr:Ig-like domain-containing protein [Gemmatimonadaceae bacterium]
MYNASPGRRLARSLVSLCVASSFAFAFTACSSDSTAPGTNPPPPVTVASIAITPSTASIVVGATTTLAAEARSAQGAVLSGRTITWASSATTIATVSASGVVTGVAAGSARISATSEGRSADVEVTVTAPVIPVAAVAVTPTTASIAIGATTTLAAEARDAQGAVLQGRAITWTTSSAATATVSATGVVTGVAAGTARITATSEGRSAEVQLTVTPPVNPVVSINISPVLDTIEAYELRNLTAVLKDSAGRVLTNIPVTWTSSNAAVATVGAQTGALTGVDRGTVTITATVGNLSATAQRVVVIKYRSLVLGTQHACDIASGGIAWCWGMNGTDARLGDAQVGDQVHRTSPFQVPGGHRFVQLAAFSRYTCGLRIDGAALCWGNNGWGTLGGANTAGYSATPIEVSGNLRFKYLSAGIEHACGITTANASVCWGYNAWGQFGAGHNRYVTGPQAAAAGVTLSAIEAGDSFSCGLTNTGAAHCWGSNGLGQLGDGLRPSYGNTYTMSSAPVAGGIQFHSLSLGSQYACGVAYDGTGYCWGRNGGRFGNGNTTDISSPTAVTGGAKFRQISAGFNHTCGVNTNDEVMCWGNNANGQMGAGGAFSYTPVVAISAAKASDVRVSGIGTGSSSFTCAISRDRLTTWCWGRNDFGQLGNGARTTAEAVNSTAAIVVGQRPL